MASLCLQGLLLLYTPLTAAGLALHARGAHDNATVSHASATGLVNKTVALHAKKKKRVLKHSATGAHNSSAAIDVSINATQDTEICSDANASNSTCWQRAKKRKTRNPKHPAAERYNPWEIEEPTTTVMPPIMSHILNGNLPSGNKVENINSLELAEEWGELYVKVAAVQAGCNLEERVCWLTAPDLARVPYTTTSTTTTSTTTSEPEAPVDEEMPPRVEQLISGPLDEEAPPIERPRPTPEDPELPALVHSTTPDLLADLDIPEIPKFEPTPTVEEEQFKVYNYTTPGREHGEPVMWVHIHKAFGTTICAMASAMGESIVQPSMDCNYLDPSAATDMHRLLASKHGQDRRSLAVATPLTCEKRAKLFKTNRWTWGAIERELDEGDICTENFIYAMAMRDPVSRLASIENFPNGLWTPGRYHFSRLIQCVMMMDCQGQPGWEHYDNFLTRSLGGIKTMQLPPGTLTKEHYEKAFAVLSKFHLVVPMEMLTSHHVQSDFDHWLGWHVELSGSKAPVPHRFPLSSTAQDQLRQINKWDMKLYNHVLAKYNKTLETHMVDRESTD